MADQDKIVDIVTLEIDEEEVVKRLKKLTEEIKANKEQTKQLEKTNKELEATGKKNTDQYKKNATQIETNKAAVKGLSSDYSNNQKILTAMTQSENREIGTLEKLAQQNKKLSQEKKTLNLTTEQGRKRLQEINSTLDKNNKFITDNSDAYTKQKRNIGNYQSALQGLPGPIGGAVGATRGLLQVFRALIATPIGIVLAAIAAAFKLVGDSIKSSQPLLDKWHTTTSQLATGYAVLKDRQSNIIEGILDHGLKLKDLRRETKGIINEIKEETAASKALSEAEYALKDQEIDFITVRAEKKRQIRELRLLVKDETLTDQERVDALDQALKIENELAAQEIVIAKERARISQEQVDLGKSTREELEANAQLQARVIELQTESLQRQQTIAAERLGLVRKIKAEQMKEVENTIKELNASFQQASDEFDQLVEADLENGLIIEQDAATQRAEINIKSDNDILSSRKALAQASIKYQELVRNATIDVAQDVLGSLSQLFGQQTAIGKAAAIAETTINTYKSATAAYSALAGIPFVGPILGAAAAGAAIVSGLANVRKIMAVNPKPGATGGGTAPSVSTQGKIPGGLNFGSAANNGGIASQGSGNIANQLKSAVKAGMNEADAKSVVVVDEVTQRQNTSTISNQIGTV